MSGINPRNCAHGWLHPVLYFHLKRMENETLVPISTEGIYVASELPYGTIWLKTGSKIYTVNTSTKQLVHSVCTYRDPYVQYGTHVLAHNIYKCAYTQYTT